MTRKKHFKTKRENVCRKIWDCEFLLRQYKMMREGFRTEYDRIKELLDGVETYEFLIRKMGMEKATETMKDAELSYRKKDELKDKLDVQLSKDDQQALDNLQKDIAGKKDDLKRLEQQMKDIDIMIAGDPEQPASMNQSVNQNIANLKSVLEMLADEIK